MATHSSILAWNPMDRRAWRATVHEFAKSQAQLSTSLLRRQIQEARELCSTGLQSGEGL